MPNKSFENTSDAIKFINQRKKIPSVFRAAVNLNPNNLDVKGALYINLESGHADLAFRNGLNLKSMAGGRVQVTEKQIAYRDESTDDCNFKMSKENFNDGLSNGVTVSYN